MLLEYLKSHIALFVTLILVVVIVAAFIAWLVYLVFRKKHEPQDTNTAPEKCENEEKESEGAQDEPSKEEHKEEPEGETEEVDMKKEPEKKEKPAAKAAVKAKAEKPDAKKSEAKTKPQKTQAAGKWSLYEEDRGGFGFKLLASNGEVMLKSSSPYASLQSAKAGIKTYQDNIAAGRLEIVETKKGNFFVQVNNASGRMLATSADYSTRASCESALQSIKRWAQTSTVVQDDDDEK